MNETEIQSYYEANPSAQWLALFSICLATFLTPLTLSAVNVAIPSIASDLRADAIYVSWIPASFLISNVAFMLPSGKLADIYGRKRIFSIGVILFSVACLLAYLSMSIQWLLVTRLLQGAASALIFSTGMAIVMSVFTTHNRGVALGFTAASVYLGLSFGPLIGGWITEFYGWRFVFLFQVPIALATLVLINLKLKGEWKKEQPDKVDWIGSSIFGAWIVAMFLGISSLPRTTGFVLMLLGLCGALIFLLQQSHSKQPLIRFRLIKKNHVFSHSLLATLVMYAGNYSLVFLLSLYLQFIRGMTPSGAGKVVILQAVVMAITAPIAGRLSDRYEPRMIATLGCLLVAAAFGILQLVGRTTPIELIAATLMMLGLGFGLFSTPNNSAALGAVDKAKLSTASAILSLARTMGNMIGTGVVLLLVTVKLGNAQIQPEQYDSLLFVIRWGLGVSCLLALLGGYYSYSRGNIRAAGT